MERGAAWGERCLTCGRLACEGLWCWEERHLGSPTGVKMTPFVAHPPCLSESGGHGRCPLLVPSLKQAAWRFLGFLSQVSLVAPGVPARPKWLRALGLGGAQA